MPPMPPKVPRLRWDDPLRALDVLGSLVLGLPTMSNARLASVNSVALPGSTGAGISEAAASPKGSESERVSSAPKRHRSVSKSSVERTTSAA